MVDRNLTKDQWWTSDDPTIIMEFYKKRVTEKTLKKLKHNNPKIVSSEKAREIVRKQKKNIKDTELQKIFDYCDRECRAEMFHLKTEMDMNEEGMKELEEEND